MHRSGTTMVAEALNAAGICMGVFREHNGEALHFLSLNQQMLAAAGADWLRPKVPESQHDSTLPAATIYAEHIKSPTSALWRLRAFGNNRWGFKDPRTTFTLPLWLPHFPNAKVLHVVRNGCVVAESLKRRNKVQGEVFNEQLNDLTFNFRLWEQYVAQAESFQPQLKSRFLRIRYEDLISGKREVYAALNTFVGADVVAHLYLKNSAPYAHNALLEDLAAKSEWMKRLGYGD